MRFQRSKSKMRAAEITSVVYEVLRFETIDGIQSTVSRSFKKREVGDYSTAFRHDAFL